MNKNEEITIQVSPEIAQTYSQASSEAQEQIQLKMIALLQAQMMYSHQENLKKFRATIDKASEEAQEAGLTPEILEEILAENND